MVLASFLLKNDGKVQGSRSLDVEVEVNIEKRSFDLRCRFKSSRHGQPMQTAVKDMPLDQRGSWNFLLLHFTKKKALEIVLKNASEPHKQADLPISDYLPEKGTYFMALGNACRTIFHQGGAEQRDDGPAGAYQQAQHSHKMYFRGRCSLPFFFRGVSDFKKMHEPYKKSAAAEAAERAPDKKQRGAICDLDVFVEQLIEIIVHKNLLGHTELNLMSRIIKQ